MSCLRGEDNARVEDDGGAGVGVGVDLELEHRGSKEGEHLEDCSDLLVGQPSHAKGEDR